MSVEEMVWGWDEDDLRLERQVQEMKQRMAWFERAFQDHANYLQKLQAQVDEMDRRVWTAVRPFLPVGDEK